MLTKRERDALVFIIDHQREEPGLMPTFSQIAAGLHVSAKSQAFRLVERLCSQGYLKREGRSAAVLKAPPRQVVMRQPIPVYDADTHKVREYLP